MARKVRVTSGQHRAGGATHKRPGGARAHGALVEQGRVGQGSSGSPTGGRGRLDRPGGLPPRGSRYGMVGLFGVGMVTPMMGGMALYALRGGLALSDAWLFDLFFGWVAVLIGSFLGLTYRRFWGICLGWTQGTIVVVVYPAALAAAVPIPLGLLAVDADRRFLAWYALGWLLAVLPLWICLVRMLRLHFWQPWRQPDEWEGGDEPVPRWAMAMLGATRPWLAEDIRRAQGLPEPPERSRWLRWLPWALLAIPVGRVVLAILIKGERGSGAGWPGRIPPTGQCQGQARHRY